MNSKNLSLFLQYIYENIHINFIENTDKSDISNIYLPIKFFDQNCKEKSDKKFKKFVIYNTHFYKSRAEISQMLLSPLFDVNNILPIISIFDVLLNDSKMLKDTQLGMKKSNELWMFNLSITLLKTMKKYIIDPGIDQYPFHYLFFLK